MKVFFVELVKLGGLFLLGSLIGLAVVLLIVKLI